MSWSSVKRLTSEMEALENESNRFVPAEEYYVVRVQLEKDSVENQRFAKDMLCSSPQPIAVYHCPDEVALIFSCMSEGNTHQFNGDHHRIVSKYATLFARANHINVKIVEFETQTQVITYMGWLVFQSSQRAMKRLSGGKITDNLLYFRTERELRDKLRDEANVEWNDVEPSERYGTFIRLRRKHNKIITSKLSEFFDAREIKRFCAQLPRRSHFEQNLQARIIMRLSVVLATVLVIALTQVSGWSLGIRRRWTGNAKKNCAELYKSGEKLSGVYTIDPDGSGAFDVFCDQKTAGGGWTVFQKRLDGSVDFYRGWNDYKHGFGNLNGEFWLGLDKIHRLTKTRNKLRVDLEDTTGNTVYAEYDMFAVTSERTKYQLSLGTYSGTAGDSFSAHHGYAFTTKDRDNDIWSSNCAVSFKGAWWYNNCHGSNLNGVYHLGKHSSYADGVNWHAWKRYHYSVKRAEMKIRPVNF